MNAAESMMHLLKLSENVTGGFAVHQLRHGLQCATLAEKACVDDEIIIACLCHDAGKVISKANHGGIIAAMFKPYVRDEVYQMLKLHQLFEGKHYFEYLKWDSTQYLQYKEEPYFDLCQRFADEWDQTAFDPNAEVFPIEHFEQRLKNIFSKIPHVQESHENKIFATINEVEFFVTNFTEASNSSQEDWKKIVCNNVFNDNRVLIRVMEMIVGLKKIQIANSNDLFAHSISSARTAKCQSKNEEYIILCLCQHIGKVLDFDNGNEITKEILSPYISPEYVEMLDNSCSLPTVPAIQEIKSNHELEMELIDFIPALKKIFQASKYTSVLQLQRK